jgi:osmoprotectant transport system permease protein
VLLAALIAIPAGWAIGHTGRGREFAVALSGAARAIPTLGLVVLLYLLVGVVYKSQAAVVAFVILAIPPSSRARTRASRRSTGPRSPPRGRSA